METPPRDVMYASVKEQVRYLERLYAMDSPEAQAGNPAEGVGKNFYLRLTSNAPVRFRMLWNILHWFDDVRVSGNNYEMERNRCAKELGIDPVYVDVKFFK